MELPKDFKEFIKLLNENEVQYLLVGGYAVNIHGYPRYTKDIDVWIWLDKSNIQKLLNTLKDFGFESLGLTEKDFLSKDNIIQLGYEPHRIDILMEVDGVDFRDSYTGKSEIIIDDTKVNYISIDDLITAKKKSGRLQDLADAEQLEKIKNKKGKRK
ncbi:MAG: nucleotidyltransferase [Fimbriimonadaceae bacterium]|nr:nucleotidyltransferase [Chitinophagales bacterium]